MCRKVSRISQQRWAISSENLCAGRPVGCLNKGIPIIKIRRSHDRLIFIMGTHLWKKLPLYWDRPCARLLMAEHQGNMQPQSRPISRLVYTRHSKVELGYTCIILQWYHTGHYGAGLLDFESVHLIWETDPTIINASRAEYILRINKYIFAFSLISRLRECTDFLNPSYWETGAHLCCIVHTMVADYPATQGARPLAAMVFSNLTRKFRSQHQKG